MPRSFGSSNWDYPSRNWVVVVEYERKDGALSETRSKPLFHKVAKKEVARHKREGRNAWLERIR